MELEQELLKQICALDDDTLRKSIGSIAQSMGVDPSLASMYLSDMGKIRETVANLDTADLKKVRESLGDDTMDALIAEIRADLGEK